MKHTILAGLFSLCLGSFFAQPGLQPGAAVRDAMQKVQFLEGRWQGAGWIQMGPQRHEFIVSETGVFKANGGVLMLEGVGRDAADTSVIIHQALGFISWDQQNGKYLMRAFRADGNHVDADFHVADDGSILWGFTHPMAGQIRYTIRLDNGQWVESGEMSRDGKSWRPFLEMRLSRL
ncbi:MAG: hypothetical protein L6Q97_11600 [Thermoanaerobaculia bacterium]|nr:hypothetical protein [Thermoanaerobaculia bacterium]